MKVTRDAHHVYTVDGSVWPGVTTIIGQTLNKPQLNKWRAQQGERTANEIASKAADHGTFVHMLATLHADGEAYIPMAEVEGQTEAAALQMGAFRDWYDTNVEELIGCEMFVASAKYHYAGALDFVLRMRGDSRLLVLDIKSGRSLYPDVRYQVGSYREAAIEMGIVDRKCRAGALHIPSGEDAGKIKFVEFTRHAADLQGFLSCLYLYLDRQRGLN